MDESYCLKSGLFFPFHGTYFHGSGEIFLRIAQQTDPYYGGSEHQGQSVNLQDLPCDVACDV